MNEKEKFLEEDIIAMLDHFTAKGGGHMNVDVNTLNINDNPKKQIKETISSECNSKSMACQVPTLHEGLDYEQE